MDITQVNTKGLTVQATQEFIFAGRAIFTIVNNETGGRLTFKVETPKRQRNEFDAPHFVRYLTGPDNTDHYSYVGTVWADRRRLHLTKASRMSDESRPVKVFRWLLTQLDRGYLPETVEIFHAGRCGRCGRLLTVPESIETGLGPICSEKTRLVEFDI